jgi:hypothetical protein
MCNVNVKEILPAVACAFVLSFCGANSAHAGIISVSYSLTGSGGGDPLNPPLFGNATGTLSPLGSVTWSDPFSPILPQESVLGRSR